MNTTLNWNRNFAARAALSRRTAVRELLKLTTRPGMISFAGGLPAPELFPVDRIRAATAAILAHQPARALQYGETEGVAELRDWIAETFSRHGANVRRDNVLIVTGGQQGLDLIGRAFLDDADCAAVENPTYLALLSAWRPLGASFVAIPSDLEGLRPEALPPVLARNPKLLYTIPSFQNPSGATLPRPRRLSLLRALEETATAIVEDDAYGELRYEGERLPTLLELDASTRNGDIDAGRVIHVGTFSKILAPGLRVGWIVAPSAVIEKLVQIKQAMDLHTSTLNQWLVWELVREDFLAEHIGRLRTAYRSRRDAMLAAMAEHFPSEARWTRPVGGLFLMVTLPAGLDASLLLSEALERQVAFVPGAEFHLDGQGANTLRLNFSNATAEKIEEGIRRLGTVLKDQLRQHSYLSTTCT